MRLGEQPGAKRHLLVCQVRISYRVSSRFRSLSNHTTQATPAKLDMTTQAIQAALLSVAISWAAIATPTPSQGGGVVECGTNGTQTFDSTIGKQSALGFSLNSQAEADQFARSNAIREMLDALAEDFHNQGLPEPNCNKAQECPAPAEGCEPAVKLLEWWNATVTHTSLGVRNVNGVLFYVSEGCVTLQVGSECIDHCAACPEIQP